MLATVANLVTPDPAPWIILLTTILFPASKFNVVAAPEVFEIVLTILPLLALSVIFPAEPENEQPETPAEQLPVVLVSIVTSPLFRAVEMLVAKALVLRVKSTGSNSQLPNFPLLANVETFIPSSSIACPDVSIRPPLPLFNPPVAKKVPCAEVIESGLLTSDQAAIVPPSPSLVAEAFKILPPSIVVLRA